MKKVVLSILLSFGVGLTLMGNPAQVTDDNNPHAGRNGSEAAITNKPQNPVHRGNGSIKYEFTKKTIDPSKLTAPKLMRIGGSSWLRNHAEDASSKIVKPKVPILGNFEPNGIISDPFPNKPGGHQNDPPRDPNHPVDR